MRRHPQQALADEDFSWSGVAEHGRDGGFPPGYLDTLHARQRAIHARLHREIAATFAAAANDPALMTRLTRPI